MNTYKVAFSSGILSNGYRTEDIIIKWREIQPVEIKEGMSLPEFNFSKTSTGPCKVKYSTGSFSCIEAKFTLDRLFEFYLIQVYIPSMLLVILSWVSFWIDIHAVPARVSLGLLTVLTITTQQSGLSTKLPRVSYIKAIDVWMFTCMVFVFGALIEYSAVNVLARRRKLPVLKLAFGTSKMRSQALPKVENASPDTTIYEAGLGSTEETIPENGLHHRFKQNGNACQNQLHNTTEPNETNNYGGSGRKLTYCEKMQNNNALLVDFISRVTFPALFIVFNIVYWSYFTR